ncbi:hypothetical protein LCGC14_1355600, partial [marine sediment metagenome]
LEKLVNKRQIRIRVLNVDVPQPGERDEKYQRGVL